MLAVAYDKSRALAALDSFQDSTGLKDGPWEAASGVGGGTLRKFRSDPNRSMTMATYAKLAAGASRLLNRTVSPLEFSGEAVEGHSRLLGAASADFPQEALRAPDAPLPPMRSEMPKDVPVYGTVVGGNAQGNLFDFELNGTIVDYVRRPPRIAGRRDVFAAYVAGNSMAPWREPGQLIYVEAAKPPKALDYVLVELKPHDEGEGVRPALVKRLLGITPTKVRLRQFGPAKDFDVELRTVLRVLRIMDWDELMGV